MTPHSRPRAVRKLPTSATTVDRGDADESAPRIAVERYRSAVRVLAALCACGVIAYVSEAGAQCAAQDVLRQHVSRMKSPVATAVEVDPAGPIWKSVTLGGFSRPVDLFNALDLAGCGIGDVAQEILVRPSFTLSNAVSKVDLVPLSGAQLGLTGATSVAEIYARANKLGFALAAAELGPQLRLQYHDQPVGEFLYVAMEPIKTREGEPAIFVVANGGADLVLIGQSVAEDVKIPASWRFVFVRPTGVAQTDKLTDVAPPR